MQLSETDMGVLRTVERYGDGLDLSGPRVSPMVKAAAKNLIHSGHLCGRVGELSLTDLGRRVISATAA